MTLSRSLPQKTTLFLALLSFCVIFIFFSFISLNRFIAVDEGFYLLAGKLVASGLTPYIDFFYPQMPLLPYLHAIWISIFGTSWTFARCLCSLLATIVALLLGRSIYKRSNSFSYAAIGIILFCCNGLIIGWFTAAKTYVFAAVPLFISYLLVESGKRNFLALFRAGFLLGTATNIRLFYLALIPLFFLFAVFKFKLTIKQLTFCLIGGTVALSPNLIFLLYDKDTYLFNNFGYHAIRSFRSLATEQSSWWNVLSILSGFKLSDRLELLQFPILIWSNIFLFCYYILLKREAISFASSIGLTLSAIYLLPSPIHIQYYSTTIPFLVIGLIEGCLNLSSTTNSKNHPFFIRYLPVSILFILLILTLYQTPFAIKRFTQTGEGVKGIDSSTKETLTLQSINEISEVIDSTFSKNDTVISQWPGFLFTSSLKQISGMENQFWSVLMGNYPINSTKNTK